MLMETLILLGGSAGVGVIIFLVGFLLGHHAPKHAAPELPPQPICGCEHGLNMHENGGGKCHETEIIPVRWDVYNRPTSWRERDCTCQKYVGPRPVEELFTTPILPPEIET